MLNRKLKLKIKRIFKIQPEILEEKINTYLKHNSYRIIEKSPGYIIFIDDEFSDRRRSRSDFHTRIGEGKFQFDYLSEGETTVELIYLTPLSHCFFLVMLFSAFGIYVDNFIMPIVISLFLTLPILWRIFYLNEHVFDEIMEC